MPRCQPTRSLLDHFSALKDPREPWCVLYPLEEVLLLVLCATLSGMEDFVEIKLWGEQRIAFLRRFLAYKRGTPSHDTLNDVMNVLDPELFKACFTAWVESLRDSAPDTIAINGKTSRRRYARAKGRAPLHLVSAWACRQRLVLGQEAVDDKSNEITAIPLLLERLALTGALVTIDAIGTQTEIAETIVTRGGDYLLVLKANWPLLLAEVEAFFADPEAGPLDTCETTDADHGRLETRRLPPPRLAVLRPPRGSGRHSSTGHPYAPSTLTEPSTCQSQPKRKGTPAGCPGRGFPVRSRRLGRDSRRT